MDKTEIILHVLRRIDAKLDAIQDSIMELEASMTHVEASIAHLTSLRASQQAAPPSGLDGSDDAPGRTGPARGPTRDA